MRNFFRNFFAYLMIGYSAFSTSLSLHGVFYSKSTLEVNVSALCVGLNAVVLMYWVKKLLFAGAEELLDEVLAARNQLTFTISPIRTDSEVA